MRGIYVGNDPIIIKRREREAAVLWRWCRRKEYQRNHPNANSCDSETVQRLSEQYRSSVVSDLNNGNEVNL